MNLETIFRFWDTRWLYSDSINGAISGLANISRGVQYMSADLAQNVHLYLLSILDDGSGNFLHLSLTTNTVIIPVNIDNIHCMGAKATCLGGNLWVTIYNSEKSLGRDSDIMDALPLIVDTIITKNPQSS